jgi:hypothetical protein
MAALTISFAGRVILTTSTETHYNPFDGSFHITVSSVMGRENA